MSMKKSIRFAVITAGMAFCFITSVHAADSYFSLNGFTFHLNADSNAEIHDYDNRSADVVIPDSLLDAKVVRIGDYAFFNNTAISSVCFEQASALTAIGNSAFYGCASIDSLSLPAQTELSFGSFQKCSGLESLQLSDGIDTIPTQCFYGCVSLSEVRVPASVSEISGWAFGGCESLRYVYLPDSQMHISLNAFSGDASLVFRCDSYDCDAARYARENGIPVEYSFRYLCGDANGDDTISIIDATLLQRLLGDVIEDPDGKMSVRGDVSGDGIDIMDVTDIQRYFAQLRVNDSHVGEMMVGYCAEG